MRRRGNRLTFSAMLIAGVSMAAGVIVPVMPAAAAAAACVDSQSNANCDGQSPYQSGFTGAACADTEGTVYSSLAPYNNVEYHDPSTGVTYEVTLLYSTVCKTNWAEVQAWGGNAPAIFSGKVRRAAGAAGGDGPYLMEHAGPDVLPLAGDYGIVDSPMVYSPHNQAQACLSLPPFSGSADQTVCTYYL